VASSVVDRRVEDGAHYGEQHRSVILAVLHVTEDSEPISNVRGREGLGGSVTEVGIDAASQPTFWNHPRRTIRRLSLDPVLTLLAKGQFSGGRVDVRARAVAD
jgi:hypothetical protein